MLNQALRVYRLIPHQVRARVRHLGGEAIDKIPPLQWAYRKTVLRWFYIHGQGRGVTIELTDKCNLKCHYCPKSLDIGIKGAHMSFDMFKTVVEGALREGPLARANLVGFGEPFLYPHLEEAVRYIKERSPHTFTFLTSNGTLLNAEWGRRLAAAGLSQITISVNATSREQYHRINAADEYEKVVANTKGFLEAANRAGGTMRVIVQVLEEVSDAEQIAEFRKAWEPHLGTCGAIQLQPFVNWAGQIDAETVIERERQVRRGETIKPLTLKEMKQQKPEVATDFDHAQQTEQAYPCFHLQMSRIVSREGNALACCMVYPDSQGDLEVGNVKDAPLDELYRGERFHRLKLIDLEGRLGELTPCNTCDAWKTVPNIWLYNPLHRLIGRMWY